MSRSADRILIRSVHLGELRGTEARKRAGGQPRNPFVLQPRRGVMEEHQEAGEESKEVDDFFEPKRTSLLEYHTYIEDTYLRAGRVVHSHKCTQGPRGPGFPATSPQQSSFPLESRKSRVWPQTPGMALDVQTSGF